MGNDWKLKKIMGNYGKLQEMKIIGNPGGLQEII